MADRRRYNRFERENILSKDKYTLNDYKLDQSYSEAKARDLFKILSTPPYIINGLNVSVNSSNNLRVDVTQGTAVSSDFQEINGDSVVGLPMFDATSGVINYLTLNYDLLKVIEEERTTFKDSSVSYNPVVEDYYKYQWKLSSAINPEQTGTIQGPFNITKDVNDRLLFSTDQSTPEYNIIISSNVASITSQTFVSGGVILHEGINDTLSFTVDAFTYNLDLTNLASEELTLSGLATRINSRAFSANPLLVSEIAFVIEGENRIRITSPRDATPISSKLVSIDGGNSLNTLNLISGELSSETSPKTAQDIADEINIATTPEVTASETSNKVKIFAQEPDGFLHIQTVEKSIYDTIGITEILITGAETIDFDKDIILASVQNVGEVATIDTTLRNGTIKLFDIHSGWEHQTTLGIVSGEPNDVIITIPDSDYYVVGANELEVFVNQARVYNGKGYEELGSAGERSTQFQLNNVLSLDEILYRVPTSMPANVDQLTIQENGDVVSVGTDTLNFGSEFKVTKTQAGEAKISLGITSGDPLVGSGIILANHGHLHEYGGSMEIDVTNLDGLLLKPQKTNIRVKDALLYSPTEINFNGNRFEISDSGSGYINIDLNERLFVNEDGDSIVRLGFDGGNVLTSINVSDNASSVWSISVDNEGKLITEKLVSGTPLNIILESSSGNLYQLGIENILGSGEITSTAVSSGSPYLFSLESPNGKGWGIRVDDDGVLYTLDSDNIFQIRTSENEEILTVKENGILYLHEFNDSSTSGDISWLPPAETESGGIAIHNVSGMAFPVFSDGTKWINIADYQLLILSGQILNDKIDSLLTREVVILNSGEIHNYGSTNGVYELFDESDPMMHADVYFTNTKDPHVIWPAGESFSVNSGNINTVNIFNNSGELFVENNTITTKNIITLRKK